MSAIEKIKSLSKHIHLLNSIHMLLDWDQETYMPEGSIELRSLQKEMIAGIIHEKKTSAAFKKALSEQIDIETGNYLHTFKEHEKAMLREWRRDYLLESKLPKKFVTAFTSALAKATNVWAIAKKENNFSKFLPHLEKNIDFIRKKADYLGYKDHPYDAILDEFEPGMTAQSVKHIFAEVKTFLIDLIKNITAQRKPHEDFLKDTFSEKSIEDFSHFLLEKMGLEKKFSRLDISAHPFCISDHPEDVRLTTVLDRGDLMGNIGAVMHEGGHALYQRGLPKEHYGTPLCEPISSGMHESQSRFWETFIGQSLPFWTSFFPKAQEFFPSLAQVTLDDFYKAINLVKPSFIRIHADEVTYCLHIILRFELEIALIEKSLSVKELPEAWRDKMQNYLGITPSTDREGCLQDIHWSAGLFGYFPTYALGNLYAAQFFSTIQEVFPDFEQKLKEGDLSFIRQWLLENIHRHGKCYHALNLIENVTGNPLSPRFYMDYLKNKYTHIYALKPSALKGNSETQFKALRDH